jgi:predicted amidohydrolase YtcJ
VAKLIADFVRTQPKGRWILGGFWDHESWPDKTLPTRALIDAVTPDNPVFVQRLDGHMGLANTVALTMAGITRDTPAPEGGAIVRDAAGEPTGILKDNAADLVTRLVPPATLDETMAKARAALKHAASVGVTTVQDMTASAIELRAYQQLRAQGELPVRITSHQNHGIDGLVAAGVTTGFGDDWLRIGGIKLFADGSMGSGTAAFFAPYADDPTTSGLLIQSPAALEKKVFDADAAGFQVIVHAIGDRANAVVLDIFEKLQQARGARDRRPRIEHAQVVRDADKLRFAKAGVIASIQPSHCIDDMRWAEKRIGPDRVKIAYDFKSFVDAGARISFGTDWFVEPMNPMLGLYAAVTRQFPDGTPPGGWFPEERLTLQQAVEFYTAGSAYAEFAESRKGRLVPATWPISWSCRSPSSTSRPASSSRRRRSRPSSAAESSTSRRSESALHLALITSRLAPRDGLARRLPVALRHRGPDRTRAARDARHRLDSVDGAQGPSSSHSMPRGWWKCASPCRLTRRRRRSGSSASTASR